MSFQSKVANILTCPWSISITVHLNLGVYVIDILWWGHQKILHSSMLAVNMNLLEVVEEYLSVITS